MFSGPNTGCFFMSVTPFGHKKISAQKLKTGFFQDKFYSLKAHAHYFTVLIYLATWRAVNFGIFSHFMSTNLSWCSQSNNLLMYAYYTGSQLLFMSAWSQSCLHSCDHTSCYCCPKNFLYYPLVFVIGTYKTTFWKNCFLFLLELSCFLMALWCLLMLIWNKIFSNWKYQDVLSHF